MAGTGENGDSTPKDFKECVSQEQLQATVEKVQDGMNEAIKKAVTDALIELNLRNHNERLDKLISTLTDKVTELETRLTTNNDTCPAATPVDKCQKTRCMMLMGT